MDVGGVVLGLPCLGHGARPGRRSVLGLRGACPFVEVGDQLLGVPLLVPAGAADHVGPATAAGLLAVADQLADQLNVGPGDRDSELAGALVLARLPHHPVSPGAVCALAPHGGSLLLVARQLALASQLASCICPSCMLARASPIDPLSSCSWSAAWAASSV